MKKLLNIALVSAFFLTCLVPLTGIHIHKLSSTVFLLLTLIHAVLYRRAATPRRILLSVLALGCFLSGLFGMIFDHFSLLLSLHKISALALVFFLAFHMVPFHRRTP